MIRKLIIKNFAIIENVEIDFHDGLNIITGETGSGKSIVIEAVSLALGSRADTAFVRSGAEKAVIQMVAEDDGDEYIITREISAAVKNTCRVNDEIVTLNHLNSICRKLADIHGQYDHQSLLNPDNHIRLVDMYQKDKIAPVKETVTSLYRQYTSLTSQLKELTERAANDRRQRDFMDYELREITEARLVPGEDEALEERVALLQNSEKIYENLAGAYQIASDEDASVLSMLKRISDMLSYTSEYSEELSELCRRAGELYYEFEDISASIRDNRDRAVFSPEELDQCIERLEVINALKSKHGKTIPELLSYSDELAERLARIDDLDNSKEQLQAAIRSCREELAAACENLSLARQTASVLLEKKITGELTQLSFNDARFAIDFKRSDDFTAEGSDIVEFMITTNKGESMKPLNKIASGGETSRIMLALKKIIGDYDEIPTMIFDEIDSGISGIAASTVGKKLSEISKNHQVICITHLPQIAAYGDHNYMISKRSDDIMTYTTVLPLNDDEKVKEIARLLGGSNITDTTLRSARELIDASV